MFKYLLLQKWVVLNLFAFTVLFFSYPFIQTALQYDPIFTPLMFVIYAIFFIIGTHRVIQISRSINALSADSGAVEDLRRMSSEAVQFHLFSKISVMEYLAGLPMYIGLLGTVYGLATVSIALSDSMHSVNAVADLVRVFGSFITGAMFAFVSTATGILTNIWLSFVMVFVRNGVATQVELASDY